MTATTIQTVAYVIGALVLAAVVVAVVGVRRRTARVTGAAEPDEMVVPARTSAAPMTGLEAALAQVTGRDGRSIGERIDAEAPLVDELRVPDDTGPVLRRALDRVEGHDDPDADADPH